MSESEATQVVDSDPVTRLRELLETITAYLALDVEVAIEQSDGLLLARIEGEEVGPLIGRRGHTIDAIQHLAQRIVFRDGPADTRIVIDADGYRERRAELLRDEADDAAEEAIRSGHPVELEPMPASERRVVHEHLRERGDVSTHSEGDEPERFLVITPAEE